MLRPGQGDAEAARKAGVVALGRFHRSGGALEPGRDRLRRYVGQRGGDLGKPPIRTFDHRGGDEDVLRAEVVGDRGQVGAGFLRDHPCGDPLRGQPLAAARDDLTIRAIAISAWRSKSVSGAVHQSVDLLIGVAMLSRPFSRHGSPGPGSRPDSSSDLVRSWCPELVQPAADAPTSSALTCQSCAAAASS